VPKEARRPLLDRVWDALEPGGVLVVFEHIKALGARYFDIMFTVDEIDALLGAYGPIERYLSTAVAQVDRDAAGARSVFRVVTKA
jgi:hypothetical protein